MINIGNDKRGRGIVGVEGRECDLQLKATVRLLLVAVVNVDDHRALCNIGLCLYG